MAPSLSEPVNLSNSVVSIRGVVLSLFGGEFGGLIFHLSRVRFISSTMEVVGGSIAVDLRGGSGRIFEFNNVVAEESTIRTNETEIVCDSSDGWCVLLLLISSTVTGSLFGFCGGSIALKGATSSLTPAAIWQLQGTPSAATIATNTSFILSRCEAQLGWGSSAKVLHIAASASLGADIALFWHRSSYSLDGAAPKQLSPTCTCEGNPCRGLAVRIDDASTPPMPSTCSHCLAPYGAAVPFDDRSGYDYSIPRFVGCLLWIPTLSQTAPSSRLITSSTTITTIIPSSTTLSLSVPSTVATISGTASQSPLPLQTSSASLYRTASNSLQLTQTQSFTNRQERSPPPQRSPPPRPRLPACVPYLTARHLTLLVSLLHARRPPSLRLHGALPLLQQ